MTDDIKSKEKNYLDHPSLPDVTHILFDDLISLSRHHKEILEQLYYNREDKFKIFDSFMESAKKSATNILIIGEAGIGKSSFIYKLISNDNILDKHLLYPIVIDYRDVAPRTITGCILNFLNKMVEYFSDIDEPLNTINPNDENAVNYSVQAIIKHFEAIKKEKIVKAKHLVLFLDDFDYLEDDWYKLLDYFLPFAASDKVSLILSVRPPLYEAVNHYDKRFSDYYVRNVQTINLEPLEVQNVISTRLAPLLIENKEIPLHRYISSRYFSRDKNPIWGVIRKLGIKNLDDLPHFQYPLTNKHNIFMRRITNGNLREIFDIAYDSLLYVTTNYRTLESREENDMIRKVIGREGVMKLLYDDKNSRYKILNINKYTSKQGNSLLYNVLEAVKMYDLVDDHFYSDLKRLGHQKKEVDWALAYLCEKNNRFIYPCRILPKSMNQKYYLYPEYKITDKADFYLQMATDWDEYIKRCGSIGKSLRELQK